ncbi:MAG: phosphate/phosphite/phosphonate ABC transporter substrate-binding protein [Deltaproteobacteria bacterium]|nr:MAG: phosphate/phosphite/phosphonate ABC transporter substrate-binding protein [Deltaproteobacteria bacterium]
MLKKILPIALVAAVVAGCSRQEPPPPPKPNPSPGATLRIGLIPEQNIFNQLERYQPLASYLSARIGAKIELKILPRYGNIIDNFRSENLDGAFFGSFTYALAHAKLGLSVVARPLSLDNTSTYYGMIFVRKDSGIRGIREMKGKRFAFVDKATTAGYLLPLDYFHEGGVKDYKSYFQETYFTGTHQDSIYDVIAGRADAGAAKDTIFFRLAKNDPRILGDLMILARSPEVPENALALRNDLDQSLKEGIREALLGMHDDPRGKEILKMFGAIRFIETVEEDYKAVYDYARQVGLDLATYDYIND